MPLRVIACFAIIGAFAAGGVAATRPRDYRAHAYVIKVPPSYGNEDGLALARSERVLDRVASGRSVGWLRRHSRVQLTGRRDFAISVRAPGETEAVALATAYAKALKRAATSARPRHPRARRAAGAAGAGPAGLGAAGRGWRALDRRCRCDRQERISASTSSRFSSMCACDTSDSRLSRSSGSVLDGRTLKCQSA